MSLYSWFRSFFAVAFVISLTRAAVSTSEATQGSYKSCSLGSIPRYNITDHCALLSPSPLASIDNTSEPTLAWVLMKYLGGVAITAEGTYDPETGQMCVAGCRKLPVSSFDDCEITVEVGVPPWNGMLFTPMI